MSSSSNTLPPTENKVYTYFELDSIYFPWTELHNPFPLSHYSENIDSILPLPVPKNVDNIQNSSQNKPIDFADLLSRNPMERRQIISENIKQMYGSFSPWEDTSIAKPWGVDSSKLTSNSSYPRIFNIGSNEYLSHLLQRLRSALHIPFSSIDLPKGPLFKKLNPKEIFAHYCELKTKMNISRSFNLTVPSTTGILPCPALLYAWLEAAAVKGNGEAAVEYFRIFRYTKPTRVFKLLSNCRKQKIVAYSLAICYSDGIGCDPNIPLARKFFETSLKEGNKNARGYLKVLSGNKFVVGDYIFDDTLCQNPVTSFRVFCIKYELWKDGLKLKRVLEGESTPSGSIDSIQNVIGSHTPHSPLIRNQQFSNIAGSPISNFTSQSTFDLRDTVSKSDNTANPESLNSDSLEFPIPGPHDLIHAAISGFPEAQQMLGVLYIDNDYTLLPNDPYTANTWFHKAAMGHYPPAQYSLAISLHNGRGTIKNPFYAIIWMNSAAIGEYPPAVFQLGYFLLNGHGLGPDLMLAEKYLQSAQRLKIDEAGHYLAQVARKTGNRIIG